MTNDEIGCPAIRFAYYSDDWALLRLGDVANTVTSGSRDWAKYYSDYGDKFIRMTNLSRGGIHLLLDDLRLSLIHI